MFRQRRARGPGARNALDRVLDGNRRFDLFALFRRAPPRWGDPPKRALGANGALNLLARLGLMRAPAPGAPAPAVPGRGKPRRPPVEDHEPAPGLDAPTFVAPEWRPNPTEAEIEPLGYDERFAAPGELYRPHPNWEAPEVEPFEEAPREVARDLDATHPPRWDEFRRDSPEDSDATHGPDAIARWGGGEPSRAYEDPDAPSPAERRPLWGEPRNEPHPDLARTEGAAVHWDEAPTEQPDEQPQEAPQGFLAVRGVEKSFAGRKVVKGVSLYLRRGEAVGLLGPNGAGKTTVFYMITGLVKADAGRIELDGQDITGLPMYQHGRLGIGYLPQEASIFRGLTVEQNIRAVLEVVESSRKAREAELDALLDEFNIARLRKTPSIALSGGERRRVEIARALATRPSYMLLDEPFAGIDPIAVGDIQALVRHLTQRGIGVLITDHNVRETLGLTDRAYIIYSGEVLMEGNTSDIVNDPEVRRLYLGEEFRL